VPEFKIYSGETTIDDCSIAGQRMRNENGLCSIADCKKPLGDAPKNFWLLGKVCPGCTARVDASLKEIRRDCIEDYRR
jgi:hypothetical protein